MWKNSHGARDLLKKSPFRTPGSDSQSLDGESGARALGSVCMPVLYVGLSLGGLCPWRSRFVSTAAATVSSIIQRLLIRVGAVVQRSSFSRSGMSEERLSYQMGRRWGSQTPAAPEKGRDFLKRRWQRTDKKTDGRGRGTETNANLEEVPFSAQSEDSLSSFKSRQNIRQKVC